MASKPENNFINSVHRKLDARIYREKMYNPYRSGTPDVFYSGVRASLWIEYKYRVRAAIPESLKSLLSKQQELWITGRLEENRNVWVADAIRTNSGRPSIYLCTDLRTQTYPVSKPRVSTLDEFVKTIEEFCLEH